MDSRPQGSTLRRSLQWIRKAIPTRSNRTSSHATTIDRSCRSTTPTGTALSPHTSRSVLNAGLSESGSKQELQAVNTAVPWGRKDLLFIAKRHLCQTDQDALQGCLDEGDSDAQNEGDIIQRLEHAVEQKREAWEASEWRIKIRDREVKPRDILTKVLDCVSSIFLIELIIYHIPKALIVS